jgi:hypothetical protein
MSEIIYKETFDNYTISVVKKLDGYYAVSVKDNITGEIVQFVDINTSTGEPIKSLDEAKTIIEELKKQLSIISLNSLGVDNNTIPILDIDVEYFDEETNVWKKSAIIPINSKVRINFALYVMLDENTKKYLDISGKYIVPYFRIVGRFKEVYSVVFLEKVFKFIQIQTGGKSDDFTEEIFNQILNEDILQQEGLILIDVENGQGFYEFIINKSGIYKIIPDYIMNAETLQEVYPKPKTEKEIKIFIVQN